MSHPLIVGLGSHCGDDRAGWLIVELLRDRGFPAECLRQVNHPAEILDVIGADRGLIVCDACEGPSAGAVHCWTWPSRELTALRHWGTHDMDLNDVLKLAGQLNQCPDHVEIWAVEGCNWAPASLPKPTMSAAARNAADAIWSKYENA
jgi:hydrogenase maturation protease